MEDYQAYRQGYYADVDRLQSNWPNDLPQAKPRKEVAFYAVDVDDVTVTTTNSQPQAIEIARWYIAQGEECVTTRAIHLTEEDFCQEDERRREKIWSEQLYKPTPVRRQR